MTTHCPTCVFAGSHSEKQPRVFVENGGMLNKGDILKLLNGEFRSASENGHLTFDDGLSCRIFFYTEGSMYLRYFMCQLFH